jgi:molecular chaperone DnaK (HSP70)
MGLRMKSYWSFGVLSILLLLSCNKIEKYVLIEENTLNYIEDKKIQQNIGIETLGGVFTPLIKEGTNIPHFQSFVFSTAVDNQDQIAIKLFRGNKKLAIENTYLGQYAIINIPPAPRGYPKIEITLSINEKGLSISAMELTNKNRMEIINIDQTLNP